MPLGFLRTKAGIASFGLSITMILIDAVLTWMRDHGSYSLNRIAVGTSFYYFLVAFPACVILAIITLARRQGGTGFAVAALVLAIVALFCFVIFDLIPMSLPSIYMGSLGTDVTGRPVRDARPNAGKPGNYSRPVPYKLFSFLFAFAAWHPESRSPSGR